MSVNPSRASVLVICADPIGGATVQILSVVSWLFVVVVSASLAMTRAVLAKQVPTVVGAVAVMVTTRFSPTAIGLDETQVQVPAVSVQVPLSMVAVTFVKPPGTASLMVTPEDVPGPALLAVIVQVTVSPTMTVAVVGAVMSLVTETSVGLAMHAVPSLLLDAGPAALATSLKVGMAEVGLTISNWKTPPPSLTSKPRLPLP